MTVYEPGHRVLNHTQRTVEEKDEKRDEEADNNGWEMAHYMAWNSA